MDIMYRCTMYQCTMYNVPINNIPMYNVPMHNIPMYNVPILTSTKPKRAMRLKPSNDIEKVSEHPNGNNENIATEKTKEAEKMVQMFSNECTEVIGDDDVCLIEDSPVKMNGKHALEDVAAVKDNVPIEQTREENKVASDKEQVEEIEEMEVSQPNEQHQSVNGDASMKESNAVKDECVVAVIEGKANTTDSKPEETVPSVVNVDEEAIENVNKPKPNYKRSLADSPEDVQPTKRLKAELEESFVDHNKRLQAFIDEKPNNSAQDINNHIEILQADVQRLEAMAKSKEQEWNRILYYKRVKEEIIYRLIRRRNVLEVSSTKIGEVEDYTILEQQPSISQKITKENRSSGMGLNQHSYLRNAPTTETAKLINSRADMSTRDLDGEKVTTAKMQRSILPKPELTNRSSPIINHLTSSTPTNLQHIQQPKAQNFMEHPHQIFQQSEHLNGHHQVGRQGATITAKSIIDGFYQKNPERPPRRGRRLKGCNNDGSTTSPRLNDGLLNRQSLDGRTSELGLLLAKDRNSRPSSADSSPGHSNLANINNNISNVSFNDVLMQYAKLNERPSEMLTSSSISRQQSGYPEVTLHPVSSQQNTPLHQSDSLQSNSLLHGILTKNTTRPSSAYNSFSPTLARLLTDPQRMTTLPNNYRLLASTSTPHKPSGINLTKPRNEITITPVMANPLMHQTILQQQLQRHQESAARMKFPVMDDEADDSADRLVIDEGDIHNEQNASTGGREFPENEFPKCQGCKKHEAQFVCAGCENQWYCSRSCQVSAWDEHCELCSG
ncbi:hypothetical protein Bhyg_00780 [Pseudolycoriella hygida]|uniref:MYND-type domain-containing protein n=1 Tax=Pseudolycoriella hygida TaxID=35572 RepID=A0A9Q0NA87_9DIPT|nr:hypothetical protein Bhyg_00780 [Pseudolycoriella hygida]